MRPRKRRQTDSDTRDSPSRTALPPTDAAWLEPMYSLMRLFAPPIVEESTELEDILRYFRDNVPGDFDITAGILFRKRSGGAYLVAQCFLTAANQLGCHASGRPYGRAFRTLGFDEGLQELFAGEDLIVFT